MPYSAPFTVTYSRSFPTQSARLLRFAYEYPVHGSAIGGSRSHLVNFGLAAPPAIWNTAPVLK